jgi:molybdenum cofactor guanylyltransferase
MGLDKALLVVDGFPLAVRVATAMWDAGAEQVVAVGGDEAALRGVGLSYVADRWVGAGPLGGLASVLAWTSASVLVVSACDHPTLSAASIHALVTSLEWTGTDVTVAVASGRRHPTLAAWRVATCAPVVDAAFGAGVRSLHGVLDRLAVVEVSVGEAAVADLDRPEDLGR